MEMYWYIILIIIMYSTWYMFVEKYRYELYEHAGLVGNSLGAGFTAGDLAKLHAALCTCCK